MKPKQKPNWIWRGGIAGIFAPIIFLIFLTAAAYNYPAYDFERNYLSDLGAAPSSAVFFSTSVILAGLLGMLFSFALYRNFNSPITRYGSVALVFANIFLIGDGLFPEQYGILHTAVAGLFFLLTTISLVVIGIGCIRIEKKKVGLFTLIMGILTAAFFFLGAGPIIQKITVAEILVWSFLMGIYLVRMSKIK